MQPLIRPILIVLAFAACGPPSSSTSSEESAQSSFQDDPAAVWSSFASKVTGASNLRLFVHYERHGKPWQRPKTVTRAITLTRTGRGAIDGALWPGDRLVLDAGLLREAWAGKWQGFSAAGDAQQQLVTRFFQNPNQFTRVAFGPGDAGRPPVAGRVAFTITLSPTVSLSLGFTSTELVEVMLTQTGLPPFHVFVHGMQTNVSIPIGFFTAVGVQPSESLRNSIQEGYRGCL